MSDVEQNHIPEQPQPSSTLMDRVRLGAVLGTLVAGAGGGAYGLYEYMGVDVANTDRGNDLAQATEDTNCAAIVKHYTRLGSQRIEIPLSALNSQQQVDCGADGIQYAVSNTSSDYTTSSIHSEIAGVTIKLPSLTRLDTNAHHEKSAASKVEATGGKVGGIIMGSIFGFMGTIVAWSGVLKLDEIRKRGKSVTTEVNQATS